MVNKAVRLMVLHNCKVAMQTWLLTCQLLLGFNMAEATDFSYPFLTVSIVLDTNRVASSTHSEKHTLFPSLIISQATGRLSHLKFEK